MSGLKVESGADDTAMLVNDQVLPKGQADERVRRLLSAFRAMFAAREIDRVELGLVQQGMAFFHVSGAGHEATAVIAAHLGPNDWLHLHYRDKALLLARGVPIGEFFNSLVAGRNSHSAGRQMSAHFSAPSLNVLSFVGPVGNNALQAVGVAAAIVGQSERPIVICSVGDGTTQEGEFLEAVAEAVRHQLPVLFLIEDNRYSISTPTQGQTFFDLPNAPSREFYGLPLHRIDGKDCEAADAAFSELVGAIRSDRSPRIAIFSVERLCNHTNADEQSRYRDLQEIADCAQDADPIPRLEQRLVALGFDPAELESVKESIRLKIRQAADSSLAEPQPNAVHGAKSPIPREVVNRSEYRGDSSTSRLTMREAINGVLRHRLAQDSRVVLYGQDIEDPKGDVFGVTQGLSTAFPDRVQNAPLSESTILGTSIGRALAGQRPVAFIQFADFLPLAYNQILNELGSMYWRTNGGWQCPVIVMITCGGYKPGLGPFHSQTLESVAAHTPGVDVMMPATAADAAGLLNAAFDSGRPTLFFYPKSSLNLSDRTTSPDVHRQFVPLGKARKVRAGTDLTLVTWGNPLAQCLRAADALSEARIFVDLFDLRSLSPWDEEAVVASVSRTTRLVVVHEDNHTCGFGAEVVATVCEKTNRSVQVRRIARPDTYVPFHFGDQLQILPSFTRVLETCAALVELDVTWEKEQTDPPGQTIIRAIGSGPADESVDVVHLCVQVGDTVTAGQIVAELEATKSVVEMAAKSEGTVTEVFVIEGQRVRVGAALMRLAVSTSQSRLNSVPITQEEPGIPRLRLRKTKSITDDILAADLPQSAIPEPSLTSSSALHQASFPLNQQNGGRMNPIFVGYMARPACVQGSRVVTTASIAEKIPGWTAEEAIKRTGVSTRHWADNGEDVVTMAVKAAHQLLTSLGGSVPQIGAVICSTTTPRESSPSVACQVATSLRDWKSLSTQHFAFDFNAACCGFLYGLRLAGDILRGDPTSAVLLITSEVASQMLNPTDPATIFLFGEAATATLIAAAPLGRSHKALAFTAPLCVAIPDPDIAIHLPCLGTSKYLRMDGIAVARTAYKSMARAARQALDGAGMSISDIEALVPHPGSQRILQNVAEALEVPLSKVLTTLFDTGNTSSSSIPLALDRFWDSLTARRSLAMAAFGAGFTAAAAIGVVIEE